MTATRWRWKVTGVAELIDSYVGGTSLEELGERIADRLATIPRDILDENAEGDLDMLLTELREGYYESTEDFDELLGDLYDWADAERIWIEPVF